MRWKLFHTNDVVLREHVTLNSLTYHDESLARKLVPTKLN
jgi:hypothetical protein